MIHPTAVIEEGATLGAGCEIHALAVIRRWARLGDGVVVHPGAVIGGDPQDLGFDPATPSWVRVGARTVVREHVTLHRATRPDGETQVGEDCYLMAGSHAAHDCVLEDGVILANAVLLAGHVHVGSRVFMGGGSVVHQFTRIGEGAIVGGLAGVGMDVPPFCMVTGRNELNGLNLVGLRRRGVPREAVAELKRVIAEILGRVGDVQGRARQALDGGGFRTAEAQTMLRFMAADSKRRFCRPPLRAAVQDAPEPPGGEP